MAATFGTKTRNGPNATVPLALVPPTLGEVQSITRGGSGLTSFTLTFEGQTTASIAAAASAAQVQTALEALSNINVGDVEVIGGPFATGPFYVTFEGALRETNVTQMTATPTGGTGTVTIATVGGTEADIKVGEQWRLAYSMGLHLNFPNSLNHSATYLTN